MMHALALAAVGLPRSVVLLCWWPTPIFCHNTSNVISSNSKSLNIKLVKKVIQVNHSAISAYLDVCYFGMLINTETRLMMGGQNVVLVKGSMV